MINYQDRALRILRFVAFFTSLHGTQKARGVISYGMDGVVMPVVTRKTRRIMVGST